MKVITTNPVFSNVEGERKVTQIYSGVDAPNPSPTMPLLTPTLPPNVGGTNVQQQSKVAKVSTFLKDSGLGALGKDLATTALTNYQNKIGGTTPASQTTVVIPTEAPKEGMSTGMKVGIAVGVLAIVGVVIYFVRKGKK